MGALIEYVRYDLSGDQMRAMIECDDKRLREVLGAAPRAVESAENHLRRDLANALGCAPADVLRAARRLREVYYATVDQLNAARAEAGEAVDG